MSESNFIPSLNNLPTAEYIPSGHFETGYDSPDKQEALRNGAEALAVAAAANQAPVYQEAPVLHATPEVHVAPEVLPLDYIHKAGVNLAAVRRAAQSDFELAA